MKNNARKVKNVLNKPAGYGARAARKGAASVRGKTRKALSMPSDFALVLQQVLIDGYDDLRGLSETLDISHKRMAHIVGSLKSKGLIQVFKEDSGNALLVKLSRKGKKLVSEIWPEATLAAPAT